MSAKSPPSSAPASGHSRSGRGFGLRLIRVLLIASLGVWIYSPAFRGAWIWDDDVLVISNTTLRSLHGLWEIWFTAPVTDYWPLTWTFLWVEWHVWGPDLLGYHLCNVAMHICSGFLIWRLLHRLGVSCAWLGGLLFVIHPLAVESVAWVSEIKNTLSLPFFLLAFDAWMDGEENRPSAYRRSVFYYLAAMLCKTSTVMLPAVLLLYCWWKRGRITRQEAQRMIPYLAIAVVLGLVTVYFQTHGNDHTPIKEVLVTRSIGAGTSLCFYLGKFIFPMDLVPIYPRWSLSHPSLFQWLILPLLAGLFFALWLRRETWGRHVLFGLGFFVVNLLPVLGLIKMEYMSVSWVADHLVYLPMIGLIGLVTAGFDLVLKLRASAFGILAVVGLALAAAALAWKSHEYAALFSDQEAFWNYTILRNPNLPLVRNNFAYCLVCEGKIPQAQEEYEQALRTDPGWVDARYNLGILSLGQEKFAEAEADFRTVLKQVPDRSDAHDGLAKVLAKTGRTSDAIQEYQASLRLSPDDSANHEALADLLFQANRFPEAIEQYQLALNLNPDLAKAQFDLGSALTRVGRPAEALEPYERAVQIDPNFLEAQYSLGNALVQAGRLADAADHFREAIRIDPGDREAHVNLGSALLQLGRVSQAIAQYQEALRINPKAWDVRLPLGYALGKSGRFPEAAAQFEAVLQADPQNAQAKSYLEKINAMKPAIPSSP